MTDQDMLPSPTEPSVPSLDLTNCDREPVQYPGAIMPHGVLLLLDPGDYRIRGISANAGDRLGLDPADGLIDGRLDRLWPESVRAAIVAGLERIGEPAPPLYLGCHPSPDGRGRCDCFAHRSGGYLILELEPIPEAMTDAWPTARFAEVAEAVGMLQRAHTWREGMEILVRELKRLSGFDAVQGVRFMPDGSGLVVAECSDDGYPSYLDLRFPRSDIPGPGRRQMVLAPLQYAPDLGDRPSPLLIADGEPGARQIDLGYALLRSTSEMCNRFYLNIGVRARMVLTILDHGELWGFLSCWNRTPRLVPYADRLAYRGFAEMAGLSLVEKQSAERHIAALDAKRRMEALASELNAADSFAAAVAGIPQALIQILDLEGVALCLGPRIIRAGSVPPDPLIDALRQWLEEREGIFSTDRLPALFAPAADHGDVATGLIAVPLMEPGQYLLGFRPEWVHEVRWAGNPGKPVEVDLTNGEERLTPRGSFEVWKQEVRGLARPWLPHESECLEDLGRALVLAQHADRQRELRRLLERSNAELEAFAYIVSHDLKEPLRGIHHFSQFLKDSLGDRLEGPEGRWIDTIMSLTVRMTDQISALLEYSRAGQQTLSLAEVDSGRLLESALDSLSALIRDTGAEVQVASDMPLIVCDPVRTKAVFENLIGNGIKYNDRDRKHIEIGVQRGEQPVFFVRDNGIGIEERHRDAIFTIFRRLHGRDDYGGGTGAGLTITRKHVEQQGGRLWLESTPGQGSCFFFTLGSALDGVSGEM